MKLAQSFAKSVKSKAPKLYEYNSTADVDWIVNHSNLPFLPLGIEVPHSVIAEEIENIKHLLVAHRDNDSAGWSSFCIHGKSYDATREPEYYNDNRPFIWTPEAEALMPQTVKFFKEQWPHGQYYRVRVMALEPGGYISPHTDYPDSRLGPVNIAITQPIDCEFVMEGHGTVPFEPGVPLMMNIHYRHAVVNNSNQTRYHLIVHQTACATLDRLITGSYHARPE